jgi:hypothetical protein
VVEKDMGHLLKKGRIPKESKLNLEKNLTAYDRLPREQKILVLAGVFDGEGSFGVWSRGKGRAKHLQVKVDTTDADMVARFHEMWGGMFFTHTPKQEHYKHLFRWKITGEKAWQCLKEMIPYMCQRRREKYYGLVKPIGYGSEDWGSYLQKQTRIKETFE